MQKQGTAGSVVMIASITSHCILPGYRMAGYVSTEALRKGQSIKSDIELTL